MNSTRTWVTPPREPNQNKNHRLAFAWPVNIRVFPGRLEGHWNGFSADLEPRISKLCRHGLEVWRARTGATENTGHLDELDGLLAGIHLGERG